MVIDGYCIKPEMNIFTISPGGPATPCFPGSPYKHKKKKSVFGGTATQNCSGFCILQIHVWAVVARLCFYSHKLLRTRLEASEKSPLSTGNRNFYFFLIISEIKMRWN